MDRTEVVDLTRYGVGVVGVLGGAYRPDQVAQFQYGLRLGARFLTREDTRSFTPPRELPSVQGIVGLEFVWLFGSFSVGLVGEYSGAADQDDSVTGMLTLRWVVATSAILLSVTTPSASTGTESETAPETETETETETE